MQPVSGHQYSVVSGGTSITVVSDRNCVLERIIVPGTYVGTLALYDSATAAGTAAGNNFLSLGLPATTLFQSVGVGVQCKNGLTYNATGTPLVTLLWR